MELTDKKSGDSSDGCIWVANIQWWQKEVCPM